MNKFLRNLGFYQANSMSGSILIGLLLVSSAGAIANPYSDCVASKQSGCTVDGAAVYLGSRLAWGNLSGALWGA